MSDVSREIVRLIADLNDYDAPGISDEITSETIAEFLKSRRGLALIFDALNRAYRRTIFKVDSSEWLEGSVELPELSCPIIDCHTHYIGVAGRPEQHPAGPYRTARGNWWFWPEAYDFGSGPVEATTFKPRISGLPTLHGRDAFKTHMVQTYLDYEKNFRCLLVPAPNPWTNAPLDGQHDTASYRDMKLLSEEINGSRHVGANICHPVGAINLSGAEPSTYPPDPSENYSNVWKIYPPRNWLGPPGDNMWFDKGALHELLSQLPGSSTVLIHWWDGDAPPNLAGLYKLVRAVPNVNFVIFHSCFPNEAKLAELLPKQGYANLFAEVGGVFANQILGGFGTAAVTNALGNRSSGPQGAVDFIQNLRGELIDSTSKPGTRENDQQILWGTDAIWHGSATWEIEAFRRLILSDDVSGADEQFKQNVLSETPGRMFGCFEL